MRTSLLVVLAVLPALYLATTAHAQAALATDEQVSKEDAAKLHYKAARAHFDARDYDDAVREFERAYALSPRPQLLYNIFLALEAAGRLGPAIEALSRYLDEAGELDERAGLERRLLGLRKSFSRLPQAEAERQKEQERLRQAELERDLRERAAPAPLAVQERETAEPSRGVSVPAIAAFVVAGTGVVASAVAGGLAIAKRNELRESCRPDCSSEEVAPVELRRMISDVGLGVAIAGALTGSILLWLHHRARDEAPTPARMTLAPAFHPQGASLMLSGGY